MDQLDPMGVSNSTNAAEAAPAAASAAAPTVVDLDAGENWGSERFILNHPFKLKGVVYNELSLRVPTGLDVTRFYSQKGSSVAFAIGLTQIDNIVFGSMHANDAGRLVAKAMGFLGDVLETSTTSSTT
jgi:hypothetical protein